MRLTPTLTTRQIRSDPVPTPIMAAGVWLLLSIALLQAMSKRGVYMEAPSIRNLCIDPAQRRLTWELTGAEVGAFGPRFLCRKEGRKPVRADPTGHSCSFPTLSHCHVTNFTVFPEGHENDAAHLRFQPPDPNRAAAALNLRCWVHDLNWLSCRWGRGPGATRDVRYRMFLRDARCVWGCQGQDQEEGFTSCVCTVSSCFGVVTSCDRRVASFVDDNTSCVQRGSLLVWVMSLPVCVMSFLSGLCHFLSLSGYFL